MNEPNFRPNFYTALRQYLYRSTYIHTYIYIFLFILSIGNSVSCKKNLLFSLISIQILRFVCNKKSRIC